MNLLYVAIGGAVGSTARYLLAGAINQARAPHAAADTFAVNVIGCFTFGIILAITEHRGALSSSTRAFLLVGMLGGHDILVLRIRNVRHVARCAVSPGRAQCRRAGVSRAAGVVGRVRAGAIVVGTGEPVDRVPGT